MGIYHWINKVPNLLFPSFLIPSQPFCSFEYVHVCVRVCSCFSSLFTWYLPYCLVISMMWADILCPVLKKTGKEKGLAGWARWHPRPGKSARVQSSICCGQDSLGSWQHPQVLYFPYVYNPLIFSTMLSGVLTKAKERAIVHNSKLNVKTKPFLLTKKEYLTK